MPFARPWSLMVRSSAGHFIRKVRVSSFSSESDCMHEELKCTGWKLSWADQSLDPPLYQSGWIVFAYSPVNWVLTSWPLLVSHAMSSPDSTAAGKVIFLIYLNNMSPFRRLLKVQFSKSNRKELATTAISDYWYWNRTLLFWEMALIDNSHREENGFIQFYG